MRSIGIDAVEIERFKHWHTYSAQQLEKIFTVQEIAYCLANSSKSAERFAVRFAAKEATYKALSSLCNLEQSFLSLARAFEVQKHNHVPILVIDWTKIINNSLDKTSITIHCSFTHTKTTAL
ncbi:4'-phosphopantetheinyl transferase superfamily protein, partial [Candidatus Dependentiae bacterium]|nr:4'-phosphopantetheinyl transferase superfamily protein [Candidatus Dependentiae bacterium]